MYKYIRKKIENKIYVQKKIYIYTCIVAAQMYCINKQCNINVCVLYIPVFEIIISHNK